jgi:hypothetical protein
MNGALSASEVRRVPLHLAAQQPRIGIEQQFMRIEAVPFRRRKWPVHPIAVELADREPMHVAMPHLVGELG